MRIGFINEYGLTGRTLTIEFGELFSIEIYRTENDAYHSEILKGKHYLGKIDKKIKFSKTYPETLSHTVAETFEEIFKIFKDDEDYKWTETIKNQKRDMAIKHIEKYYY